MTWKPSRLYSQNYEDLYLWRIFKGVDKGFYVDVGAFHPVVDSVTKIFYDQGWSGINLEPHPRLFEEISRHRDRDLNLQLAASSTAKKVVYQASADPGSSRVLRGRSCESIPSDEALERCLLDVQAVTLYDVILSAAPSSIHFLKVDVEGYESEVLEGLRLHKLPPALHPVVIVVESTSPHTTVNVFKGCVAERLYLLDHGYCEFFYDGLNRYYCKGGMFEVCNSCCLPPNVFDGDLVCPPGVFHNLRSDRSRLNSEVENLRSRLSELSSSSDYLEKRMSFKISFLEAMLADCQEQIEAVSAENILFRAELSDELKKNARILSKLVWYRAVFPLLISLLSRAKHDLGRLMLVTARLS